MTRVGYPLAMVAVLGWLEFGPLHSWWLYEVLGFILAAVAFVLSALILRKWRVLVTFFVLLAVWIICDFAVFAYRLNNVCGPGGRIIQSEAAAIKMAKALALSANYASSRVFDDKPDLVEFQADDCCTVTKTRTSSASSSGRFLCLARRWEKCGQETFARSWRSRIAGRFSRMNPLSRRR